MEIQINHYPVDFKLEGEKTITDVINSISEWTQQRDLVFTEAVINKENYSIDNLPDIPLDDIRILNCFVQSKAEIIITSLNAGADYCSKIQKFIDKALSQDNIDNSEISNIISGIDWLTEVLNRGKSSGKHTTKPTAKTFSRLLTRSSLTISRELSCCGLLNPVSVMLYWLMKLQKDGLQATKFLWKLLAQGHQRSCFTLGKLTMLATRSLLKRTLLTTLPVTSESFWFLLLPHTGTKEMK